MSKPLDINAIVGQIAKRLIESGKDARKSFLKMGREIMRYGYAPDHNFEYTKLAPNTFFKAKAALTAEAFAIFGPYLFPNVPTRTLTPRAWVTPEGQRRTDILSQLLNYTPKETALREQCRRALIEAIGYGRGVLWTGLNKESGLVWSMWDSVRNLITDPNARVPSERKWVARRRVMPRFEAIEEWPQAKEIIEKMPSHESRPTDLDGRFDWEKSDVTTDVVEIFELYLRTGIHNFKGGIELVKAVGKLTGQDQADPTAPPEAPPGKAQLDNSASKVCVTFDGKVIEVSPWEVPFHDDQMFPCTEIDFLDNPDSDWPVSILAAGLGYQKAINWLMTLMMGKYRFTSRTIGALAKQGSGLSQKDKDKILIGSDIEMLELPIGGGDGRKLGDFIQQFEWSQQYMTEGMRILELFEDKYQKSTGLYEILYAGDTSRQIRSAQEAQMKERASKSRIDDMKDQVQEWMSKVARKEALASRFLYDRDLVGSILGPQAAQDWGFLVRPEAMDAQAWVQQNIQAGMDPATAIQQAQQQLAQAVNLDSWRKEIDYSIEAGSMRRRDIDTKIDALKEMMNQTVPTLLQSPDPTERSLAFDTMAEYYDAIGAEKQLVDELKAQSGMLKQQGQQYQMLQQANQAMQLQQLQMQSQMMAQGVPPQAGPNGPPQQRPSGPPRPAPKKKAAA